ncbi:MAG TPA: phospho-sugar mutase [Polyangiaceae bacterium]|nr:phospho-sugar mutase [Polyangiaceae bacterium]
MNIEEAISKAQAWIAADPDPETRRELQALIDRRDTAQLIEVMGGSLEFGTAGLRAIVGPGPMRMNRAVVRRTTAGVARYLAARHARATMAPIVVGADGRLSSPAFMQETVGVLAAHGLPVRYFRTPIATPIAAYVARRLGAPACIVITASHNPAAYNGYKLYGSNAVQIVPPVDSEVAREIERSAPASDEAIRADAMNGGYPDVQPVPDTLYEDYLRDVAALRPPGAPFRDLVIAYTPMHGVGAEPVRRVLTAAGFSKLHAVPEQSEPDGHFPTVRFPNPEEPGALDLVMALARRVGADLVLANDPDVDRLAACLPDGSGNWVPLTGNQIGVLLADYALERAPRTPRPLVAQSIVSTPMLESIAAAYGARCEQTLTGFKWIWTAALDLTAGGDLDYAFGFEEALGYCCGQIVRDKDGISAALILSELAALERSRGSTLRARLESLYRKHGLWVSVQRSVTRQGLAGAQEIQDAMDRISARPPQRVLDAAVTRSIDYRTGGEQRPRWLENTSLMQLDLGERGRVLVRPSGTEPKLKVYVDLRRALKPSDDVWKAEDQARAEARRLAEAVVKELGFKD